MSLNRQQVMHDVLDRKPKFPKRPDNKISTYYGENVFNKYIMRSYLPDEAYEGIIKAMEDGTPVDRKVADQTASALTHASWLTLSRHYSGKT